MKNLLSFLAITLCLTGCGTTRVLDTTQADSPLGKDNARLIISRDDSALYFASSAIVEADSQEIADLGRGGTVVHDVRAGSVSIAVHAHATFGYYVINMEAKPGKTYRFMITPRGKQMIYSPLGVVGDYINGQGNDKTGYFQIGMVP